MKSLKKILNDEQATPENIFTLQKHILKKMDYKEAVKEALLIGLIEEKELAEVFDRTTKTVRTIAEEKKWKVLDFGTLRFYRLAEINPDCINLLKEE